MHKMKATLGKEGKKKKKKERKIYNDDNHNCSDIYDTL